MSLNVVKALVESSRIEVLAEVPELVAAELGSKLTAFQQHNDERLNIAVSELRETIAVDHNCIIISSTPDLVPGDIVVLSDCARLSAQITLKCNTWKDLLPVDFNMDKVCVDALKTVFVSTFNEIYGGYLTKDGTLHSFIYSGEETAHRSHMLNDRQYVPDSVLLQRSDDGFAIVSTDRLIIVKNGICSSTILGFKATGLSYNECAGFIVIGETDVNTGAYYLSQEKVTNSCRLYEDIQLSYIKYKDCWWTTTITSRSIEIDRLMTGCIDIESCDDGELENVYCTYKGHPHRIIYEPPVKGPSGVVVSIKDETVIVSLNKKTVISVDSGSTNWVPMWLDAHGHLTQKTSTNPHVCIISGKTVVV